MAQKLTTAKMLILDRELFRQSDKSLIYNKKMQWFQNRTLWYTTLNEMFGRNKVTNLTLLMSI